MGEAKLEGICRLCGTWDEMSKEHIPPKSAFNNRDRVFETITHTAIGRGRQKFRGGVGIYTLCNRCNNKTGGDYGTAYVEWAKRGIEILETENIGEVEEVCFEIMPLNVLKQVCTMAVAMMSPNVINRHLDLRRFLLNKESRNLPGTYGIYTYFTMSNQPRMESEILGINTQSGEATYVLAEVAFSPFGFCVIPRKALLVPAKIRQFRLFPIDWFVYYEYNEIRTVQLRLPKLEVTTQYPLDYRTRVEVQQQPNRDYLGNPAP